MMAKEETEKIESDKQLKKEEIKDNTEATSK